MECSTLLALPIEVLAYVLGYVPSWTDRSLWRLVCRRWDAAIVCFLENYMSEHITEGEWSPVWDSTVHEGIKQTLCNIHRMPSEMLLSVTAVDFSCSCLGRTINGSLERLVHVGGGEEEELERASNPEGNGSPHETPLCLLPRLKRLTLKGCGLLVDAPLLKLATVPSLVFGLQSIDLTHCSLITSRGVSAIAALKNLQELHLPSSCFITEDDFGRSCAEFRSLRVLSVANCGYVTDSTLVKLVTNAPGLRSLDLSRCNEITEHSISKLWGLPELRWLDLSRTRVTDASLQALALTPGSLVESLDLSFCDRLTDDGVSNLTRLGSLQRLCLRSCARITEKPIFEILDQCTSLLFLDVASCDWVPKGVRREMEEMYPDLWLITTDF